MIRYRFHIETPWIDEWDETIEFDEEPTEAELLDCLEVIYANSFPASWERLEEADNVG